MKKNFKYYALIWAVFFALFNIICFAIPEKVYGFNKYAGSIWIGYIAIAFSFIFQLICSYFAFQADDAKKFFYSIPLIRISYIGLVLMFVFGGAAMAIPNLPKWIGGIVCLLILAFTVVAVIKASAAADIVSSIDMKTKTQTLFVKSLTADMEGLVARASSDEAKEECRKVYEAVRYSDPVSNEALAGVESQITLKCAEFSGAVASDELDSIKKIASEIIILLSDRNNKCKLLK